MLVIKSKKTSLELPEYLDKAIAGGRLGHALLLHGKSIDALQAAAEALSCRLFNIPRLPHPDLFELRPTGKSRSISVDGMRELILNLQHTSNRGEGKVAIIHEADRMNSQASNAFLKTLEEPPPATTLILLTTRPAALLPTIRSRCYLCLIPGFPDPVDSSDWLEWLNQYHQWLTECQGLPKDASSVAKRVMWAYGLISQYLEISEGLAQSASIDSDESPTILSEEEIAAIEAGRIRGIRRQLLADLAERTRQFTATQIQNNPQSSSFGSKLTRVTVALEKVVGLREVYLNEGTALESFFLQSLRIWAE